MTVFHHDPTRRTQRRSDAVFPDLARDVRSNCAQPRNGWPTSPTSGRPKAGCMRLRCWICSRAASSAGGCTTTMTSQLVADALMMAVWRRGKPAALLHHSDQGSQCTLGNALLLEQLLEVLANEEALHRRVVPDLAGAAHAAWRAVETGRSNCAARTWRTAHAGFPRFSRP